MKSARERAMDEIHMGANAQTLVVAAMESGFEKERFIRLVETTWDDTEEAVRAADELEAMARGSDDVSTVRLRP